jgi:flagellar protein FlaG
MTIDINTDRRQPLKLINDRTDSRPVGANAPATPVAPSVAEQHQAKQAAEQQQQPQEVKANVAELNSISQNVQRSLLFELDEDTGDTVVTVKDKASGEVIRQIPSEEMLELSKRLKALNEGLDSTGVLLKSDA